MNVEVFQVPVPFTLAVRRSSRHKLKDETFYSVFDIEIAKYDGAEAPRAASFHKFGAPGGQIDLRASEGRFFESAFYAPIEAVPFRLLDPVFLSEDDFKLKLARMDGDGFSLFPKDGGFFAASFRRGELGLFDALDFFQHDVASLQKLSADLQSRASTLAIIDGLVFSQVPEPVYKVRGPATMSERGPTVSIEYTGMSKDGRVSNEFPMTGFDDASEYAIQNFGSPLDLSGKARVFLPGVFGAEKVREAVVELLGQALDAHGPSLAFSDTLTISNWAHLRDAVARARKSRFDETVDQCIEKLGPVYAASPSPNQASVALLKHATERWSTRPMQTASASFSKGPQ